MKRTFIAINVSEEVRRAVSTYVDGLRRAFPHMRVGWERPEKLHLTLKFLGDVYEADLQEVRRAVENVAGSTSPFQFSLAGTGRFPPKGPPRVLWLGVEDSGAMGRLVDKMDKLLTPLGFGPERRRFSPHLTIARLREPGSSVELAQSHTDHAFGPIHQEARAITVYESRLLPTGSVYQKIASIPLAGL